ncbi:MAG TPA: hypothetical protein VK570_17020 [Rubrivivax sp.]|jgi:hypothetical protein|nr:hypothetical protein [Rubrivivax sp.]
MHAAPPVAVRCTAGKAWRGMQAGLAALSAGVLVFWGLSTWADPTSVLLHSAVAAVVALSLGAPVWWLSARPAQLLQWDSQRWSLDGQSAELRLMIDLGSAMLLRHGGRRWVAATRADAGSAWHALRVAVLAGTSPDTRATEQGWLNA